MKEDLTKREIIFNIFYTIFKRKFLLFWVFIITFLAILLGTFMVTPVWKATALIWVEPNLKQQIMVFDKLSTPGGTTATVNPALNMIQILMSRGIAEKIVMDFGLDKIAEQKAKNPKTLRDKTKMLIADIFMGYPTDFLVYLGLMQKGHKNILADEIDDFMDHSEDIELAEETSVINLTIWEQTPKLARDIANTMADLLIDKTLHLTHSEAHMAYDFIKKETVPAEKRLKDAEENLRRYKEHNLIVNLDEEAKVKINSISDLEVKLAMSGIEKREAEERIKDVRKQLAEQKGTIKDSEIIASIPFLDELKNTLKDLEIKMASLLTEKQSEHPDVINLKASIDEIKKKLKEEAILLLEKQTKPINPFFQEITSRLISLEIELVSFSAREEGLTTVISNAKKELNSIPNKEIELERLTRELTIKQGIYNNLKVKEEELGILKNSVLNELSLKIIDEAYVFDDVNSNWPLWILNIIVGLIASFVWGLVVIFFIEYWNDSIRSSKDIYGDDENYILGSIPLNKNIANYYLSKVKGEE